MFFKRLRAFEATDWISLAYLTIAAGVTPLVVRMQLVSVNADELALFPGPPHVFDVFSYNKAMLLVGATIVALLAYAITFKGQGNILKDIKLLSGLERSGLERASAKSCGLFGAMLPVRLALVLGLVFVLSALVSSYGSIVLWGAYQRYEGLIVLLCYVAVFLSAMHFCRNRTGQLLFIGILAASALVIGILAVFQVAGRDFFLTPLGARLVYGQFYTEGAQLVSGFTIAYSTLYNPNYLGQYAAFTMPIFIMAAVASRCWIRRMFFAGTAVLMFVSLLASGSSGALFSLVVSVVFGFILGLGLLLRQGFRRTILLSLCGVLVLAAGIGLVPQVRADFIRMAGRFTAGTDTEGFILRDFYLGQGHVDVLTRLGELRISHPLQQAGEPPALLFEGVPVPIRGIEMNEEISMRDTFYDVPGLGEVMVRDVENIVQITAAGSTFNFEFDETGGFHALTQYGGVIDLDTPIPATGFEGNEGFASSRGFIWSRTIPVVMGAPLLGYGPDTFTLSFPQHDIRGKLEFLGEPYIRVDKPHNIYLQFAVNTGLISALLLLALLALVLLRGAWLILTEKSEAYMLFLRLGLVCAVVAFAVSGAATDSNVNTSPVFWGVLGLAYAVCQPGPWVMRDRK